MPDVFLHVCAFGVFLTFEKEMVGIDGLVGPGEILQGGALLKFRAI